jgi:uncharacterized protein YaiI (UPF0178 family)
MNIWVDADACPKWIKEILFRASLRTRTPLILVANQYLSVPPSAFIKVVRVGAGFDVADNYIVEHLQAGDLVITADIPLADGVITKKGFALNPRGELYTESNIKLRLSVRNLSENLRSTGVRVGGPSILSKKEIQAFANALDQFLTRHG